MVQELNAFNFIDIIETKDKLVLVDFWVKNNKLNSVISPNLLEVSNEFADKALIGRVDLEEENMLAMSYDIEFPTMLLFKDGKIVEEIKELTTKENIKNTIEKYIN